MPTKLYDGSSQETGVPCFKTPIEKPDTKGPQAPDPGKVQTEHDYDKNVEKGGAYTGKKASM